MKNHWLLSLSLLLLTTSGLVADPESSAFEEFQRAVRGADPKLVGQRLLPRDRAERRPTKEETDKFVQAITRGAVAVLGQAEEFEKHFPSSQRISEVRASVVETLWKVFGASGLPIPQAQLADVESITRKRISEAPGDARLPIILCRVAGRLPKAEQEALYKELSGEATPEPARSMASNALQKLERVGRVLDLSFTALDGRSVCGRRGENPEKCRFEIPMGREVRKERTGSELHCRSGLLVRTEFSSRSDPSFCSWSLR